MTRGAKWFVLLVPVLAFAGGGGSSTKKVAPAADLALAKSAVLAQTDLPDYTAAPHEKSSDLPAGAKSDFA